MDIYKIIVFIIQIRYDARKMFVMLVEVRHQRFPSVYLHSTIALVLNDVKLYQFVPIYHNLSQFITICDKLSLKKAGTFCSCLFRFRNLNKKSEASLYASITESCRFVLFRINITEFFQRFLCFWRQGFHFCS